jgi:RHS repeat-associated protein
MQRMVASSIPNNTVPTSTRAQSRAGKWIASFDFDLATTRTPPLPTIASTNESLDDSSMTTSTLTGPFCCNHQYSVTAITTSTGAIAERYAYTAYGQPTILNAAGTPLSPQTSTLNSRYSYTGREWDATLGLHHFRARWMSPSAGRFLGRDPIGYLGSMWGLYELFDALVLKSTDSTGLATCTCHCGGGPSRHGHPVEVTTTCGGNADSCCHHACHTIITFCVYKALPGEDGGISGTIYLPAELDMGPPAQYKCPLPNRCHDRLQHLTCGYFPTKCSKLACKLACGALGLGCGAGCDRRFGGNPRTRRQLIICRALCGALAVGCSLSCESCEDP